MKRSPIARMDNPLGDTDWYGGFRYSRNGIGEMLRQRYVRPLPIDSEYGQNPTLPVRRKNIKSLEEY